MCLGRFVVGPRSQMWRLGPGIDFLGFDPAGLQFWNAYRDRSEQFWHLPYGRRNPPWTPYIASARSLLNVYLKLELCRRSRFFYLDFP